MTCQVPGQEDRFLVFPFGLLWNEVGPHSAGRIVVRHGMPLQKDQCQGLVSWAHLLSQLLTQLPTQLHLGTATIMRTVHLEKLSCQVLVMQVTASCLLVVDEQVCLLLCLLYAAVASTGMLNPCGNDAVACIVPANATYSRSSDVQHLQHTPHLASAAILAGIQGRSCCRAMSCLGKGSRKPLPSTSMQPSIRGTLQVCSALT